MIAHNTLTIYTIYVYKSMILTGMIGDFVYFAEEKIDCCKLSKGKPFDKRRGEDQHNLYYIV